MTITAPIKRSDPRAGRRRSVARLGIPLMLFGVVAALTAAAILRFPRDADPESLWRRAEAAVRAGRLEEAELGLRRLALRRSPTAGDLLLGAQVAGLRGDDDEAVRLASLVPDADPKAPIARIFVAKIERQRKRLLSAEQAFRGALRLDPKLIEARKGLIYIYGVQCRRIEVHEQFLALAELTSLTPRDLIAWEHTHSSSWDSGIAEDLLVFLQAEPSDRATRLALAEFAFVHHDLRPRIAEFLAPLPADDPDATALRARLAIEDGRPADAGRLLAAGPPDHPGLERMRGRLDMGRHDYHSAAEHFRRAIRPGCFDRSAYFFLGQALHLAGDEAGAAAANARYRALSLAHELVDASAALPERRTARDILKIAIACEQAKLLDEAGQWFSQVIRLDAANFDAQVGAARVSRKQIATP